MVARGWGLGRGNEFPCLIGKKLICCVALGSKLQALKHVAYISLAVAVIRSYFDPNASPPRSERVWRDTFTHKLANYAEKFLRSIPAVLREFLDDGDGVPLSAKICSPTKSASGI